jgi:hypothetical protein
MKSPKTFYYVFYGILPKKNLKWMRGQARHSDMKFTSLAKLKKEIQFLEDLYRGRSDWKVTFGPIFKCTELK